MHEVPSGWGSREWVGEVFNKKFNFRGAKISFTSNFRFLTQLLKNLDNGGGGGREECTPWIMIQGVYMYHSHHISAF